MGGSRDVTALALTVELCETSEKYRLFHVLCLLDCSSIERTVDSDSELWSYRVHSLI